MTHILWKTWWNAIVGKAEVVEPETTPEPEEVTQSQPEFIEMNFANSETVSNIVVETEINKSSQKPKIMSNFETANTIIAELKKDLPNLLKKDEALALINEAQTLANSCGTVVGMLASIALAPLVNEANQLPS